MKALGAIGRAIAPVLRTVWLAALRADLRRAVLNILRGCERLKKRFGRKEKIEVDDGSCRSSRFERS